MFLPFHFGPGLAIKGLIPKHFSFSMFAFSNVLMDVETLYRMWRIQIPIYGFSHTMAGAMLIAVVSVLLGRVAIVGCWRLYEQITAEPEPFRLTWLQAIASAVLGVSSHLLIDAVMSADVHPFAPWIDANPLLMPGWMLPVYLACVLAAMMGMLLILCRAALQYLKV